MSNKRTARQVLQLMKSTEIFIPLQHISSERKILTKSFTEMLLKRHLQKPKNRQKNFKKILAIFGFLRYNYLTPNMAALIWKELKIYDKAVNLQRRDLCASVT